MTRQVDPASRARVASVVATAVQALLLAAVVIAAGWMWADPGPEPLITAITALVALLTIRRSSTESPVGETGVLDGTRVAVLPLENITGVEAREYVADGLTEELISVLSRVHGLRVIARSSVAPYRARPRPIAEIGRELNVGSVLEGSVRATEDALRVSVRLVDVASQSPLWSADYDRAHRDVFTVQRDIAREVAGALQVSILGPEAERIDRMPTADLEAYDLYLLARHDLNKRTADGLARSIDRFRAAVARDGTFAAAYAGLADAYVLATIGYADIPFATAIQEARTASARSLAIEETLSDAHTSRGWVLLNHEWDFAGAERAFSRAIELNPSDARAYQWFAQCHLYQNRCEEAIPLSRKAQALDPRSPLIAVEAGWPYYYLGRNAEALRHFRHALELEPDFPLGHFNIGNLLETDGKLDEALMAYDRAVEASGNGPMYRAFQARALARLGRREEAMVILDEVVATAREGAPTAVYAAHVYDALGEVDEALTWLELAAERRESIVLAIHSTWLPFTTLHGHPRYRAILDSLPVTKRS